MQFYPHITHLQRAPAAGQDFCAGYPALKILPNPPGKAHVSIGTGRIKAQTHPQLHRDGRVRVRGCAKSCTMAPSLNSWIPTDPHESWCFPMWDRAWEMLQVCSFGLCLTCFSF